MSNTRSCVTATTVLSLVLLGACHAQPTKDPVAASVDIERGGVRSDSEPKEQSSVRDSGLHFHLVAEVDYEIEFAPLGEHAFLLTDQGRGGAPLLIENDQLRFSPALADFDIDFGYTTAAGGAWPDDTWMAVNGSSDAGPCWATLYRWHPDGSVDDVGNRRAPGWVPEYELGTCARQLVNWRGGVLIVGAHFSVPVIPFQEIMVLSPSSLRQLRTDACAPPNWGFPPWVHDDAVTVFGSVCGELAHWPQEGGALRAETWYGDGTTDETQVELPHEEAIDGVVVEQGSLFVLTSPDQFGARQLIPLGASKRGPLPRLSSAFSPVNAPASHALWGIRGRKLLRWSSQGWEATELPKELPSHRAARKLVLSVWQPREGDIWLIARVPDKGPAGKGEYLLFNTAGGKLATELPATMYREPTSDVDSHAAGSCTYPFADLIVRHPHDTERDLELSVEQARDLLSQAIVRHPPLRNVPLLQYSCFGGQCIGAHVADAAEAQALRAALAAGEFGFSADVPLRCAKPPRAEPFQLAP